MRLTLLFFYNRKETAEPVFEIIHDTGKDEKILSMLFHGFCKVSKTLTQTPAPRASTVLREKANDANFLMAFAKIRSLRAFRVMPVPQNQKFINGLCKDHICCFL